MKNADFCFDDEITAKKATIIWSNETDIDPDRELYLLTWVPDPDELPDVGFRNQHEYLVRSIVLLCQVTHASCFCVESTQMGRPHYHGWYQHSSQPDCERYFAALIKTMIRFGLVKINKAKHFRVNSYTKGGNSLHYYKKECMQERYMDELNPIDASTDIPVIDTNHISIYFWSGGKKRTACQTASAVAKFDDTLRFYLEKI